MFNTLINMLDQCSVFYIEGVFFPIKYIVYDNSIRLTWIDDLYQEYYINLEEDGISKGNWDNNKFTCEDHEGDEITLIFFSLKEFTQSCLYP